MPMFVIPYPMIPPVLVSFGPFAIRWYALAYVAGLILGWWMAKRLAGNDRLWGGRPHATLVDIDDLVVYMALGVVLGGRIAYILFYNFDFYLANPWEMLTVWRGGMSFHGGLIGSLVAMAWLGRSRGVPVLSLYDNIAPVVPIGLFLGRLANFVNGELWGRVTDVPWAMAFPTGGPEPRHPSQLYEAGLEGLLLFVVLVAMVRAGGLRRPGLSCGLFATLYGLARILVEFFREPDAQLGYLLGTNWLTMGMILSLPVVLGGLALVVWGDRIERGAAATKAEPSR